MPAIQIKGAIVDRFDQEKGEEKRGCGEEIKDLAFDEEARHELKGSRMESVQGDPIAGGDIAHEIRDGKS